MPRPKALVPSLRAHICGQSVCEIGGTMYYLGPTGSPVSLVRHPVLVREYQQNGLSVPPHITSASLQALTAGFSAPVEKVCQADEPILVRHLTALYRSHIEEIYKASPVELGRLKRLCDELDKHNGKMLVDEYGPVALQEQRQRWVKSGKSRSYCNHLTNATVRIFKFGVSQEMVDPGKWTALKSVEPLRMGQTSAPETEPVTPVPIEHVRATVKHLSPVSLAKD